MTLQKIKQNSPESFNNFILVFFAGITSLLIVHFASSLKILNPKNGFWLRYGDGNSEISWEFYRLTPFPNWLVGEINLFGLEASKPLFYSTVPPLYALLLRPFSQYSSERFQFFGLMIFFNLFLIYVVAYFIFKELKLTHIYRHLGSLFVALSPISLHRFIDFTHYVLTSNWIILLAILLILKKSISYISWSLLITLSLLVLPYYTFMVIVMGGFWFLTQFFIQERARLNFLITIITSFIFSLLGLYVSGFFSSLNSTDNSGFGFFKANLISIIDSNGWSRFLPRMSLPAGDYEGFGYIGLASLALLVLSLIHFLFNFRQKLITKDNLHHISLWISALILFTISLSNNIDFLNYRVLDFILPEPVLSIVSIFRSGGRFIWVISYLFVIYSFYYFSKKVLLNNRLKLILITLVLLIHLYDIAPRISQDQERFVDPTQNRLTHPFWSQAKSCASAFHSIPAQKYTSHNYDLADIAFRSELGIYPPFAARTSAMEIDKMVQKTRNDIKLGAFSEDRIYVFQSSEYVVESTVKTDMDIAIRTMTENSRAGWIDGLLVLVPNFENCEVLKDNFSNSFSIKKRNDYRILNSELAFNTTSMNNSILVEGWSAVESWGVWTTSSRASLILEKESSSTLKTLTLRGKFYERKDGSKPNLKVEINNLEAEFLVNSEEKFDEIIISIPNSLRNERITLVDLYFENLVSPLSEGASDDPRELGFALTRLFID